MTNMDKNEGRLKADLLEYQDTEHVMGIYVMLKEHIQIKISKRISKTSVLKKDI